MKLLKKTSFAFIAVLSFLLFACSNGTDYVQAKISSFEFTRSQNESLSQNVSGTINESTKTITVEIPLSEGQNLQTVKSSLKNPSVSLSNGTQLVTNLSTLDFSVSPVEIFVTTKDETLPYSLLISEKKPTLARNTLAFTEYYNGEPYNYKGANNQFIEIYNASNSTIDLGSVQLNRISYEGGIRTPDKDRSVTLSGTLSAGQYLVLSSAKNEWASTWTSANVQTDAAYSNIITFNGYDCFTLTSGSTVLDVLGPQDGWPWGNTKHMQRKWSNFSGTYTNRGYRESEWVISKATNSSSDVSSTVGRATADPTEADTSITYFELENSSEYYASSIDNTNHELTLTFYNASPNYVQKPSISTNGANVQALVNNIWQTVITGDTELDFSRDIRLRVAATTGSRVEYIIKHELNPVNMSSSPAGTYRLVTNLAEITSGSEILIYYLAGEMVMSTTAATGFKSISVTPEDDGITYTTGMMSLCVTKFDDGTYFFTNNSKFLTSAKDTSSYALTLDSSANDYSFWRIATATSSTNTFYIQSVNGVRNNSQRYLEVYGSANEFQTYGAGTSDAFKFQIYKKQ